MLTKNFYSYMRAALQKTPATFTLTTGVTNEINFSNDTPPFKAMNVCAYNLLKAGTHFGTGTTPATTSDYFLESVLDSTKINVSEQSAVSYSRGDTFDEYSVSFGVTNITAEAITISEVGLSAIPYGDKLVLVDHTVLDAPVTIPPHETKHIAYTIRFNYGDAV